MGELQVRVLAGSKEKTIWRVSRNYGDRWVLKEITLVSSQPFQIIFQAERGDGYLSDFAIDDVTLKPGACKLDLKPTKEENSKLDVNIAMLYGAMINFLN